MDRFTFPGTSLTVNRIGYGAMRLTGPRMWGPPRDHAEAVRLLREAAALGINHIDTSDYYGPHTVNRLIREALHPYPEKLVIVTKVGYRRTPDQGIVPAFSAAELTQAVHDNLRNLGLEQLHIVNLRLPDISAPVEEPLTALRELQQQGLIAHLGLSNVGPQQFAAARQMAEIVCVQNKYNLVDRADDTFIDGLARQGVAYVPFFPLGGFSPFQSADLDAIAASLRATPMQIALAWLLHRSPNILPIPGTSSLEHLRANVAAAQLTLSGTAIARLNALGQSET